MKENSVKPSVRLLLVDDHEVVRSGLRALLSEAQGIILVGEAESLHTAILKAKHLDPDVVLLDVRLPDGTGFEACRQIRAATSKAKVLFLTAFPSDEAVFEAIAAGGNGFLLKEMSADRLVSAIHHVANGHSVLDPVITNVVMDHVRNSAPRHSEGRLDLLSPQEKKVLALVSEGKTNKEVARAMDLSDKTVKNYLSNLLKKLELTRRSQAAAFFAQHQMKRHTL